MPRPPSPDRASPAAATLVPIASGGGRHCYAHPIDPALCVKIAHAPRGEKESRLEWQHLASVERWYGKGHARHVVRCFGPVATSVGTGWLVERVRDADGARALAPSLLEALDRERYAAAASRWQAAFAEFAAWVATTPVVVRDLSASNFCVQRRAGGTLRLVLVDGFGPKEWLPRWLPLRAHTRRANRRAIARRGVHSIEALLDACERERVLRRARAPLLPPAGVRLLG